MLVAIVASSRSVAVVVSVLLERLHGDHADHPSPARIGTPSHDSASRRRWRRVVDPAPARWGASPRDRVAQDRAEVGRSGRAQRSGRRVRITCDVRPGPNAIGSLRIPLARPRSRTGTTIIAGRLVVGRDQHRAGVEHRTWIRSPTSSMIDSKSSCRARRVADLVDDGELGVALPGLLDRPRPAPAPRRRAGRRRRARSRSACEYVCSAVYDCTTSRPEQPALGAQRDAEPDGLRAGHAQQLDLARSREALGTRRDRCRSGSPRRSAYAVVPVACPTPNGSHAFGSGMSVSIVST